MAIRIKHLGDIILEGQQAGNATTGIKKLYRAPFNGKVIHAAMRVRTAGTTGNQVGDVNINGTSIFATAGNRPTLTTGTDVKVSGSGTIDGTRTFAEGDILDISIDTIHTTPAVDSSIVVILRQERSRGIIDYAE